MVGYSEMGKASNELMQVGTYIPPTQRKQLEEKQKQLINELAMVDAALAALDAHPELEKFTETLRRALR